MNNNFDFFVFTLFKDTALEKIKAIVKDIYCEECQSGKLLFTEEPIAISDYYNPSLSGNKNEMFSFWTDSNFANDVFFASNSADGKYTLCNCLSSRIGCDYLMCRMSSENAKDYYPKNSFNYIRQGNLDAERCVLAYKNPKWTFYET